MLSRKQLMDKLREYVESPDICLFDLDLPSGSKGALRIFIARREKHSAGVSLEECASVSKRISAAPEFDEMLHVFSLEVSSPGVNRRLRNEDHFQGAVGERVKLSAEPANQQPLNIIGVLKSFSDGMLEVEVAEDSEPIKVKLGEVKKAQVDFLFK